MAYSRMVHSNFFDSADVAKYNDKENRIYLLAVQYPDRKIAEVSYKAFWERFLHDSQENFIQIEDGTWLGEELHDNLLICVFNAKTSQEARNLLSKVTNHP